MEIIRRASREGKEGDTCPVLKKKNLPKNASALSQVTGDALFQESYPMMPQNALLYGKRKLGGPYQQSHLV